MIRAFILGAEKFREQWGPHYNPSKERLEAFIEEICKTFQERMGPSCRRLLSSWTSMPASGPGQSLIPSCAPFCHATEGRHLESACLDAVATVLYDKTRSLRSGEIWKEFVALWRRIVPLLQGRNAMDWGEIVRSLGTQHLSVLLQMLCVPNLQGFNRYLHDVLLPEPSSKQPRVSVH